jgi:hypothetical protein
VDSAAADKAWSSSVNARIAINNAISAAAGTSGPALPVALESGQFCGSVTIASA